MEIRIRHKKILALKIDGESAQRILDDIKPHATKGTVHKDSNADAVYIVKEPLAMDIRAGNGDKLSFCLWEDDTTVSVFI